MSYAVVMNPPKSRAVSKYHKKLREIGSVYKQMKEGDRPSWQQFVSKTLKGAKFNPPGGMQIGVSAMSFSLTYLVTDMAEHKVRKASFEKYLMETKLGEEKSNIVKYYGSQIASTVLVGSTTTLGSWLVAKKFNQGKSAIIGGVAAMLIKIASRSADLYKCKDYEITHVLEKEAKKWASADKEYFGEQYKPVVDYALQLDYANGNGGQQQVQTQQVVDQQIDQSGDSNTVAGYIDDPNAINYMR